MLAFRKDLLVYLFLVYYWASSYLELMRQGDKGKSLMSDFRVKRGMTLLLERSHRKMVY